MSVLSFRVRAYDPDNGRELLTSEHEDDGVLLDQYLNRFPHAVRYFDVIWRGVVVFSESHVPNGYYKEDRVIGYLPQEGSIGG